MKYVDKYFPELSNEKRELLLQFQRLLSDWNLKINLISRKDEEVELHHILHSLSIAKYIAFAPGSNILDLGTGGGLPGIPLAILFPDCNFLLVDSIGKKVMAVQQMIDELNLKNASAKQIRVENLEISFDFVVTRAVAKASQLRQWTSKILSEKHQNALPNGILALKGGDLKEELSSLKKYIFRTDSPR